MSGEIVLQRKNLPSVADRTLREETNFRQAVKDNPARLRLFEGFEYLCYRLTQFEIGGIEQSLLLIGVQRAFSGGQLKHLDIVSDCPTVRSGPIAQLLFGF